MDDGFARIELVCIPQRIFAQLIERASEVNRCFPVFFLLCYGEEGHPLLCPSFALLSINEVKRSQRIGKNGIFFCPFLYFRDDRLLSFGDRFLRSICHERKAHQLGARISFRSALCQKLDSDIHVIRHHGQHVQRIAVTGPGQFLQERLCLLQAAGNKKLPRFLYLCHTDSFHAYHV